MGRLGLWLRGFYTPSMALALVNSDGLDRARCGDQRTLRRVFGAQRDHKDVLVLPFPRYSWPSIVQWC
jgi:hypothetical protein